MDRGIQLTSIDPKNVTSRTEGSNWPPLTQKTWRHGQRDRDPTDHLWSKKTWRHGQEDSTDHLWSKKRDITDRGSNWPFRCLDSCLHGEGADLPPPGPGADRVKEKWIRCLVPINDTHPVLCNVWYVIIFVFVSASSLSLAPICHYDLLLCFSTLLFVFVGVLGPPAWSPPLPSSLIRA